MVASVGEASMNEGNMLDLEEIKRRNNEATEHASKNKRKPWKPSTKQRQRLARGESLESVGAKFPFLGDYVPPGYEQLEPLLFIDTSGFGSDDEPAISWNRLACIIGQDDDNIAYAMVEHGQFQGYMARYRVIGTKGA